MTPTKTLQPPSYILNVQSLKALKVDLKKIFNNNELLEAVVAVMQKTVLIDSKSIVRRVMSGLIQGEDNE